VDGYVHRRLAHALGCAILAMSITLSGPPVPLHAQTAAVCSGVGLPCPTFTKDVAAILQRACQECHRPESIGPMPLVTYADVRPWAKAIRQKVLAREMPPWFVDPRVGVRRFKNDPTLTNNEIETIVRWVDAGAAQGNPADLPTPRRFADPNRWTIGDPDLIVAAADRSAPSSAGAESWTDFIVETGLTEDRYLSAVETLPGRDARDVTHHVLIYVVSEDGSEEFLNAYVAGGHGDVFPSDAGRLMSAGSKIRFNVHFHAGASQSREGPRVGFKFLAKGVVPSHLQTVGRVGEPSEALDIPAGASNVRHDGYFKLEKPSRLISFQPHMHARGKALCIEAILPTMTVQPINCVNRFNSDWQLIYNYADDSAPLFPAGTILHVVTWHDNSSANPNNPDPRNWVGGGGRKIDEMSFAWVSYYTLTDDEFARETRARKTGRGA
jgi:hypothetical protein